MQAHVLTLVSNLSGGKSGIMTAKPEISRARKDTRLGTVLSFRASQKVTPSTVYESQECQNHFCCQSRFSVPEEVRNHAIILECFVVSGLSEEPETCLISAENLECLNIDTIYIFNVETNLLNLSSVKNVFLTGKS